MTKNLILGLALGAITVVLVLVLTGKLVWNHPTQAGDELALLEQSIAMHSPTVIELGGEEVLCLPITRQRGKEIIVDHRFYVLKDGELKELEYRQGYMEE